MENYFTFTRLLGLRDTQGANLPLFKDARNQRYQSVQRMMDLISIALTTSPKIPTPILTLNPQDPQWDDQMPFPIIDRRRYWGYAGGITSLLLFYSYNYNVFSTNIRYRTFRAAFPFFVAYLFADAYASYRKQILKINLFDQYCYLRAKELVKQNQYLLDHPSIYLDMLDVKRFVWWEADLQQTLNSIHRQANNNHSSDFKDSELILQNFINRYVDPNAESPMQGKQVLF